jgi:hypothetical protein
MRDYRRLDFKSTNVSTLSDRSTSSSLEVRIHNFYDCKPDGDL